MPTRLSICWEQRIALIGGLRPEQINRLDVIAEVRDDKGVHWDQP